MLCKETFDLGKILEAYGSIFFKVYKSGSSEDLCRATVIGLTNGRMAPQPVEEDDGDDYGYGDDDDGDGDDGDDGDGDDDAADDTTVPWRK